jgi:putative sigma-54 modulation protein
MRTVIIPFDRSHKGIRSMFIYLKKQKGLMNLLIESPHIEGKQIPEALIRRKFEHFDKLYDHIEYCDIVLRKEKSDVQNSFFIEAKMKVPQSILFSSDSTQSFEMTLDKVVHDLENQLRRHKEKQKEKR